MINHNIQTNANLATLMLVAKKLGTLKEELVFLGGCSTALLLTDNAAPDVRYVPRQKL